MPSPLIPTPGAPDANTYVTRADADTYFDDRITVPAWDAAADEDKDRALLTATALLDSEFTWVGWVWTSTQALLFPRYGLIDRLGNAVDEQTIPGEIENACAELGGALLSSDRLSNNDIQDLDIRAIRAGSVALQFGGTVQIDAIPDTVYTILPHWWYFGVSGAGVSETIRT